MLLAVLTLGFSLDIGFVSITIGLVLALMSPKLQERALGQVSWPEIMLIVGVSTYVGVMQKMGTIDFVGNSVAGLASPLMAALVLCLVGAVVSAFASSTAVLGSLIPLAVPFLQQGTGVTAIGFIAAMAVSSTIVDVSPFSTNGALVLANAPPGTDRRAFFRQLMTYGMGVMIVAPFVVWLLFVVRLTARARVAAGPAARLSRAAADRDAARTPAPGCRRGAARPHAGPVPGSRIVLATFGSLGDLHPYLSIAVALRGRGHRALLAVTDVHRGAVEAEGIEFRPLAPGAAAFGDERAAMRRALDPVAGPEFVIREVLMRTCAPPSTTWTRRATAPTCSSRIRSPSPRRWCERRRAAGLAWASVAISPSVLQSAHDPAVLAPAPWLRHLRPLGPAFHRLLLRRRAREDARLDGAVACAAARAGPDADDRAPAVRGAALARTGAGAVSPPPGGAAARLAAADGRRPASSPRGGAARRPRSTRRWRRFWPPATRRSSLPSARRRC